MKVYLLNPSFVKNFVRSSRCTWIPIAGSNWYPIFFGYATGLLEKNGFEVRLRDALVSGVSHEKVLQEIKDFNPSLIVIYTSLDSIQNEFNLTKRIKEISDAFVVFVGPWCAMNPAKILEDCPAVDGVIRREFEMPLLNLAKTILESSDLVKIKELTWRRGDETINNPDGEFATPEELDGFPFVTDVYRRHLNIRDYYQTSLKYPFIDLFTARGCAWGKCTFCLWPNTIHKGAFYRMRNIDNVIEEIKFVKKEMPEVKEIFFQDDMLPRVRMREISEALLKNNIKIAWSGYAKADLDFETLRLAKKAGCRFLHIGYESANNQILENVCKGETKDGMLKFSENAKKAGIRIHGDFIIGLPGETKETILETIEFAKKINISDYQFVVPQPHPATPMYQWLKMKGHLGEDGRANYPGLSSDDLEYWRFYTYRQVYLNPQYIVSNLLGSVTEPAEFWRLIKMAWRGFPKLFRYYEKRS